MKYIHHHVYTRLYTYLAQHKHIEGISDELSKLNHRLDKVQHVSEKHFQELCYIVAKYEIPLPAHDISISELLSTYPEFAYVLNAPNAIEVIHRHVQFKPVMGSRDRLYYRIAPQGDVVVHYVQDDGVVDIYGPILNLCFVAKALTALAIPVESMQIQSNKFIPNIKDFEQTSGISIYTGPQNLLILKAPFAQRQLNTNNPLLDQHLKRQLQHSLSQLELLNDLSTTELVMLTLERLYHHDSLVRASNKLLNLMGYSRWTLARKLKQEGQTFDELLNQFKQKKCYEVLSYTSIPLVTLSERLGFQSQSSLNRFTMRNFGLSPMEIRSKINKTELTER
ncbi:MULTISPECIES: helix-turn-helix domain-containing protein [Vibrio]|uniref:AraC family transcriptional regulator n=1 Tax=Vibrio TaxID=662 RepID=UPI0003A4A374|nr:MULTISPECIES: helix-turn-helix domain-containing protein [Vibrio]UQA53166.1 helix-turn-helix domain-containing protein [Vibrio sp. ED002]